MPSGPRAAVARHKTMSLTPRALLQSGSKQPCPGHAWRPAPVPAGKGETARLLLWRGGLGSSAASAWVRTGVPRRGAGTDSAERGQNLEDDCARGPGAPSLTLCDLGPVSRTFWAPAATPAGADHLSPKAPPAPGPWLYSSLPSPPPPKHSTLCDLCLLSSWRAPSWSGRRLFWRNRPECPGLTVVGRSQQGGRGSWPSHSLQGGAQERLVWQNSQN